jgi:uncharacterized protein (TIGR03382 family)
VVDAPIDPDGDILEGDAEHVRMLPNGSLETEIVDNSPEPGSGDKIGGRGCSTAGTTGFSVWLFGLFGLLGRRR